MKAPAFRFFHDQLPSDVQRIFYDAVETGVRERKREIICPLIAGNSKSDYMHLLEHVYDDHPEFFSFYPLLSEITASGVLTIVRPFYRYSAKTQAEYETALDRKITKILQECFPKGYASVSEIRREKTLFDWITRNVVYDQRSIDQIESRQKEHICSVAWNAYGALVCGTAVCEGIACAFKLLCDRVDLPSIVVIGKAGGERHAWNMVRVNRKFYHVDCTWDLASGISTEIPYARYRYFNLPDQIISANHVPESSFLPVCGSLQYNPFRIRKLCAFTPDEVNRIALQMHHDGQKRFAVMTIGFRAADCAETAAGYLARCAQRDVRYYMDDSGYFLGFVIQ